MFSCSVRTVTRTCQAMSGVTDISPKVKEQPDASILLSVIYHHLIDRILHPWSIHIFKLEFPVGDVFSPALVPSLKVGRKCLFIFFVQLVLMTDHDDGRGMIQVTFYYITILPNELRKHAFYCVAFSTVYSVNVLLWLDNILKSSGCPSETPFSGSINTSKRVAIILVRRLPCGIRVRGSVPSTHEPWRFFHRALGK